MSRKARPSDVDEICLGLPEDELGNGYEYLIKKFADDSGHTAQYQPHARPSHGADVGASAGRKHLRPHLRHRRYVEQNRAAGGRPVEEDAVDDPRRDEDGGESRRCA